MKGQEEIFVKYMEGSGKRFVIPVYQRNYDWKTENCKQLYDDLVKISKRKARSHFFGSVVSVYNPDGHNEEFLIIDGQQRLTTVSLLFLAMYNLMDKGLVIPQMSNLKQRIFEEYLVDKWKPEDTRIKLKPVKNDRNAFDKLFSDPSDYIRESNLTVNYDYFFNRIQKQEITIDELFDAICRLEIINIRLDSEDNPQMIFESLNSTGLDLSEGDKIRNFILMGLPSKNQEEFYEKYWNHIEVCTKYDVSAFIRDYLSVKQQSIPKQTKVYVTFKDFVELGNLDTEPLLVDMLEYAKRYQILLSGNTGVKALDACIQRMNRLETTVTRPFLLEVLRMKDAKKLTDTEVTEIFLIAENYVVRRMICEIPTNSLNKTFLMLHKEVMRYDGTDDNYVDKIKFALVSKKDRVRFPDDSEFADMFSNKQIYLLNSKNKLYIMERLENFGTAEDKDVYRHCDDGTYSIEHIMPQHLTPVWQKELGLHYADIHEKWLHRIANLTLTAYNSQYSNSSFIEKKTMPNGFDDSGIRMNTWISKKDKWTQYELEERDQYLVNRAMEIWPRPETSYKPVEKQLDMCTLVDSDEVTGRQIAKFAFKNAEQPATSWVEMYQKVVKILYAEDKSIITKFAVSNDENLDGYFGMDKKDSSKWAEIGDGIFAWTNTSTAIKMSVLTRLFKLYKEDPEDLIFYLRDDNDSISDDKDEIREIRKKYWSYALPIIKEAHGKDEVYSKTNPTTDNWIYGAVGISGFYMTCVSNLDSTKVELVFSKPNIIENAEAFDILWKHKNEIEYKLGMPLKWKKGEVKSSKVYVKFEKIGISDETNWFRMANLQAEWSKKFVEVLLPYLH